MTSVSGSDLRFHSLDPGPNYSDEASGFYYADEYHNDADDELDEYSIDEETYEYLTNHYFRAGHEGCDEYTTLTTFHGMIRVFNSRNCPSLIFWCLVVTTCLVFYMMVCGTMISSYSMQPSFLRVNETKQRDFENEIELCAEQGLKCSDIKANTKCQEEEKDAKCISIRFSTKVKIRLKKKIDVYFKHGSEKQTHYLLSDPYTHHLVRLKVSQIERLNLARSPCHYSWRDVTWIAKDVTGKTKFIFNQVYSLRKCEELRKLFIDDGEVAGKNFPCQPACFETSYQVSDTVSSQKCSVLTITFSVFETITHMQETRKTTLVDILCFLGGASSLFMGCSCVTLMEMFVFLFKLVVNSVCSKEAPEPDDSFYQEKYAFEFSDHRNKRRFAICNRETLERYLLNQNSTDVKSINLDKRMSVFSYSAIKKAPKLQTLRDNRNFENIDIYDQGESTREESVSISPKDEYSVDYQDEKMDTLGATWIEADNRRTRPPLRRASTATSFASRTSKGSSSLTTRSFAPIQHNRRNSRAFTRNMPMNDF